MFAFMNIPLLPEQASEFSREYDVLFWYITGVSALGAGVVYSLLIYCCFAFAPFRSSSPFTAS